MIVLITPTGARPIQFGICTHLMQQQTYAGKVVWIIIDDCYPQTINIIPDNFKENWIIVKVFPTPIWLAGQNTQARNISIGIKTLMDNFKKEEIEAIFIIEDDDYYRPRYLDRMMVNLKNYSLIGERNTIYYNVQYRRFVTNPNTIHASLFQTAFTLDALSVFKSCYSNKFIDCVFWSLITNKNLFYENDLAIGIKGLPGRGGIGAGHSKTFAMRDDRNLNYLKALIGIEDTKLYEKYYRDTIERRPLFQRL